ncbi:MAG: hypothetical protein KDD64_02795, partial [Bdellovibrionales bacterium]|nr:hypothetical protein [Bdellovibrionales bacterium]
MKHEEIEEKFLEYLEGGLSKEEHDEIESRLSSDPKLRDSLAQYQKIVEMERFIAKEQYSLDEGFPDRVMSQLDETRSGFLRRLFMKLAHPSRPLLVGVGSFAVLLLTLTTYFKNQE